MNPTTADIIGTILFALAVLHTFSTRFFEKLANRHPRHGGAWHLLAEVEVVFGFWASVLCIFMLVSTGKDAVSSYLDSLNFTEPMFVFAIMVVAGTRPVLQLTSTIVFGLARLLPTAGSGGIYFCVLTLVPLLGSLITEPAAMTVAALTLQAVIFDRETSTALKYATIGVLFVNVSIGGTLTHFAAPPVVMVASKFGWGLEYMMLHFGWKSTLVVVVNTLIATIVFRKQLKVLAPPARGETTRVPLVMILMHLLFLVGIVVFSHTPHAFLGIFLFFLGFTAAYPKHQDKLILREGLLVAFFLAGLVVLGTPQQWWLQSLLSSMSDTAVYFGAAALTAITDNAALTYLGSLVSGTSESFKYALVAGAVVGGGMTVIANAPNPAGFSILRKHFPDGAISPVWLAVAALGPTLLALLVFWLF